MTSRDISLAEATGGRLHIMHVSSAGSVDLVRRAKARGVRVTTEVMPASLHALTDDSLANVRLELQDEPAACADVSTCGRPALRRLVDGTIDVMCTRTTLRTRWKRRCKSWTIAPFGAIVGLETALGVVIDQTLVEPGHLDWPASACEKMTINPARVLGIDKGTSGHRRRCRRYDHRPRVHMDRRSGSLSIQEQQHAVRWR